MQYRHSQQPPQHNENRYPDYDKHCVNVRNQKRHACDSQQMTLCDRASLPKLLYGYD